MLRSIERRTGRDCLITTVGIPTFGYIVVHYQRYSVWAARDDIPKRPVRTSPEPSSSPVTRKQRGQQHVGNVVPAHPSRVALIVDRMDK